MDVVIRRIADKSVMVDAEWPDAVRVPVVGDAIDLVDGLGPRAVLKVTWTVGKSPVAVDVEVTG